MPYRVPEVWLFQGNQLAIYSLQGKRYEIQTGSRYFPGTNVSEVITECFQIAYERNTSAAVRGLRRQLECE